MWFPIAFFSSTNEIFLIKYFKCSTESCRVVFWLSFILYRWSRHGHHHFFYVGSNGHRRLQASKCCGTGGCDTSTFNATLYRNSPNTKWRPRTLFEDFKSNICKSTGENTRTASIGSVETVSFKKWLGLLARNWCTSDH